MKLISVDDKIYTQPWKNVRDKSIEQISFDLVLEVGDKLQKAVSIVVTSRTSVSITLDLLDKENET